MQPYIKVLSISLVSLFVTTSVFAKPPLNLSIAKNDVVTYYDSGQYEKDVNLIVQNADHYLTQRIEENNFANNPKKLAIVLDIDDTSLTNYPSYKETDFAHTKEMINASFREASAPAIKPVLALYNKAVRNGVAVFFVSLRSNYFRNETINNLQKAGYYGWKAIFLPTKKQAKLPAQVFKTSIRKHITQQGYHIILSLGDQDSDLKGGYTEQTAKIPNPLYAHIEKK